MTIHALAPAKINLGLEVLGQRDDGYHEVRTVLAAVSLFDRLAVRPADADAFWTDRPELAGDDNLVVGALRRLAVGEPARHAAVELRKRIPTAAGLGGASSDAAATLLAARTLFGDPIDDAELATMAAELGSDVPFFLHGGTALGEGRGERLTALPPITGLTAVVVAPRIAIASKTAALYRALRPSDFTDGSRISSPTTAETDRHLDNAFARPLYERVPSLATLPDEMRRAGATRVGLSGAGPAHYALEPDLERAHRLAGDLRRAFRRRADVFVCRFCAGGVVLAHDSVERRWSEDGQGSYAT